MPWGTRARTTYDLVSHGGNVENKNQCHADWNGTANTGWGPAYQYNCIHSGSNEYSGGNTTWYNYALATAGTIYDENTTQENPATNRTLATESVCPKGWTLPSRAQIRTIGPNSPGSTTYVSIFSPVEGGRYANGGTADTENIGRWWGSDATSNMRRSRLDYENSTLFNGGNYRHDGIYIRCVQAS